MIKKIFIWTSPLPLLLFYCLWIYLKQVDGWGQWVVSFYFVAPILLSLLMAILGLVLVVQARRKKVPAANLWVSTLMASSLFLYILVKVILEEITRSFG